MRETRHEKKMSSPKLLISLLAFAIAQYLFQPLLSCLKHWHMFLIPDLSLHIWTSSETTCLQLPPQAILSKPTPVEKLSVSKISIAYIHIHPGMLKITPWQFETWQWQEGWALQPKWSFTLIRQGLHPESVTFRCPDLLPQSKRWFSIQSHHIRPQNWSPESTCSVHGRDCPQMTSIPFPLTTARWQAQTGQLSIWDKSHFIWERVRGFQHWPHRWKWFRQTFWRKSLLF